MATKNLDRKRRTNKIFKHEKNDYTSQKSTGSKKGWYEIITEDMLEEPTAKVEKPEITKITSK